MTCTPIPGIRPGAQCGQPLLWPLNDLHHLFPLKALEPPNRRLTPAKGLQPRCAVGTHDHLGLDSSTANVVHIEMELAADKPQVLEKIGNGEFVFLGILDDRSLTRPGISKRQYAQGEKEPESTPLDNVIWFILFALLVRVELQFDTRSEVCIVRSARQFLLDDSKWDGSTRLEQTVPSRSVVSIHLSPPERESRTRAARSHSSWISQVKLVGSLQYAP